MINKAVLVLQNCMDLLEVVPGSYNETCPASCDKNNVLNIKAEEVTDVREEDPLQITFPGPKDEHEVRYMPVIVHC